jgi:prepilin-type N-terminal cleavage/methylation domain-containing protein
MRTQQFSERGFSLIEVVIATSVLSVGLLGAAAVLTTGMQRLGTSPNDVIATQKASEAVESVFSARDSHKLTWSQLQNVNGATGSDGGVFIDGLQPIKLAGVDGLVNTADDTTVETVTLPGIDQLLGTADDKTVVLSNYRREIAIRDIPNEPAGCGVGPDPCTLRSVTVTVTYQDGKSTRTYTLTTYISNFS